MSPQENEDLLWLAYRFVSDELSPEEAAEFNVRLGEDQAAREAVAAAVELGATMKAALCLSSAPAQEPGQERVAEPSSQSAAFRWPQRLAWMAIGTAACLAAVLVVPTLLEDGTQPVGNLTTASSPEDQQASGDLALMWASWTAEDDGETIADDAVSTVPWTPAAWNGPDELTSGELITGDLAAQLLWENDGQELLPSEDQDRLPSWMMAVVSLDSSDMMPSDGPPAPQEN